ncbi:hypothetical protein Tco_1463151, partial [Tanacetum coccineum]
MSVSVIERLVNECVAEALAEQEANRKNVKGDGNIRGNVNVNGNWNVNVNGDENTNAGGVMPIVKTCTYKDFLNCQPLNFKGTEGA